MTFPLVLVQVPVASVDPVAVSYWMSETERYFFCLGRLALGLGLLVLSTEYSSQYII